MLEERTKFSLKRQVTIFSLACISLVKLTCIISYSCICVQHDIDSAVEVARQRAAEQYANLEKDIRELAEKNAHLKGITNSIAILDVYLIIACAITTVEFDKAHRDSKSQREQLEKVQRLQESERAAFESATRELSERLNAAVVNKEEEIGRRHEIQELNKDYRANIDKLRVQVFAIDADLISMY